MIEPTVESLQEAIALYKAGSERQRKMIEAIKEARDRNDLRAEKLAKELAAAQARIEELEKALVTAHEKLTKAGVS